MNFWTGQRVLVTGATGFFGSALTMRLVQYGARVVGLVLAGPPAPALRGKGSERSVELVRGSVTDRALLERTLAEHAVDIVYHLGAQAIVSTANRSPVTTFETNIAGTWNLLEACRLNGHLRAVVIASTDGVYWSHADLPCREDFGLNAEYPYDVSKACADLIARTYFRTFGVPTIVTRSTNVYGPGDLNFTRIIPSTIRSVLDGVSPVIRSDGSPERGYIYIDDLVDLYLLLVERIEATRGEMINVGHDRPVPVREVVERLLQVAGRSDLRPTVLGKGTPAGEVDRLWLDAGKGKAVLGWEPRVSLDEGLRRALAWYAAHRPWESL